MYKNFWSKVPCLRVLIPFICGILLQWYFPAPALIIYIFLTASTLIFCLFQFMPVKNRYRLRWLPVICGFLLFNALGAWNIHTTDIRNKKNGINITGDSHALILTMIDEPVMKARSYKVTATAVYPDTNGCSIALKGKLIIYFSRNAGQKIHYGTRVLVRRKPVEIKDNSNPGGFDFRRYCLFQGITHQLYLDSNDFRLLSPPVKNAWRSFLFSLQQNIVTIIKKYIHGQRETGLAEALLIGYKDDLDKELVQSYSNTGVVHIIAISGLHLGLIYWLLAIAVRPLKLTKQTAWTRPLVILAGLWTFSFLAGAQPSILRSAIMFTCIVAGQAISRRTSTYNTMALSAMILLLINPFWLWDAGFQLSYSAVISILVFMKPIYQLPDIKNKLLDLCWKMNAVTIAAQIFTLPFVIYHFHQFPTFFLLTNFIAVPLSSAILLAEILLCCISFLPGPASLIGNIVSAMTSFMNAFVIRIENMPMSVWEGLQINSVQAVLLFFILCTSTYCLAYRSARLLFSTLFLLLVFALIRSNSFILAARQEKFIVYNIPNCSAVEWIKGRHYFLHGDQTIIDDPGAQKFYMGPAHTLFRVSPGHEPGLSIAKNHFLFFKSAKILLADHELNCPVEEWKCPVDLLVVSGKYRIDIACLASKLHVKKVVADSSVPRWKKSDLENACTLLHIPFYDVSAHGAFVMNLR